MLKKENEKAKILYVDDSEADRDIFRRLLTEDNFEVLLASDGAACVSMAYQQSPDCIIMDCNMPVMDGFEACSKLKSSDQTKFIPIILVTGYDSENAILKGLESGADDFMGKTVNRDIILAKINAMLRAKYLQNELKAMVVRDSLTHLYNYKHFLEISKQEFSRSRRYNTELSCLMFDVDFFKMINDGHGHAFGDTVIKQVAVLLKESCRLCDIIARYGGDEFIILLPNTGYKGAVNAAERIQKMVRATEVKDKDKNIFVKFSLSGGISSLLEDNIISAEELIKSADKGLYAAKEAGRNTVMLYKDILRSHLVIDEIEKNKDLQAIGTQLQKIAKQSKKYYFKNIKDFLKTMEKNDKPFVDHSLRVASISSAIARELNLGKYAEEIIEHAGLLHEVGMLGVKEEVMLKINPLNNNDWIEIRKHPLIALQLLRPIKYVDEELKIILYHHERYDGGGYPVGMKGDNIPMGARIISVACAVEAMYAGRPYQSMKSCIEICDELIKMAGLQFDPKIVMALFRVLKCNNSLLEGMEIEEDFFKSLSDRFNPDI
ncbi:MAG: diguanylate cyclase [Candidatus Omnitrophica bacterium]|nr:diguanylate cyclase [Candidatus Omnitrophota bacterium]